MTTRLNLTVDLKTGSLQTHQVKGLQGQIFVLKTRIRPLSLRTGDRLVLEVTFARDEKLKLKDIKYGSNDPSFDIVNVGGRLLASAQEKHPWIQTYATLTFMRPEEKLLSDSIEGHDMLSKKGVPIGDFFASDFTTSSVSFGGLQFYATVIEISPRPGVEFDHLQITFRAGEIGIISPTLRQPERRGPCGQSVQARILQVSGKTVKIDASRWDCLPEEGSTVLIVQPSPEMPLMGQWLVTESTAEFVVAEPTLDMRTGQPAVGWNATVIPPASTASPPPSRP